MEGRPHRADTCSVAMHGRPEYRILKGDRVGGPYNGEVTVTGMHEYAPLPPPRSCADGVPGPWN